MSSETWLSRKEAARYPGTSYDRIRRADEAGRLPGRRVRPGEDGPTATLEYPLTELVAAGLVDTLAALESAPGPAAAEDPGHETEQLRRRVAELEVRLERRDADFDRVARLLELALGRAA